MASLLKVEDGMCPHAFKQAWYRLPCRKLAGHPSQQHYTKTPAGALIYWDSDTEDDANLESAECQHGYDVGDHTFMCEKPPGYPMEHKAKLSDNGGYILWQTGDDGDVILS